MRLMSKTEYLIVPKGTKFTGSGKLGLKMSSYLAPNDGIEITTLSSLSKNTVSVSLIMGRCFIAHFKSVGYILRSVAYRKCTASCEPLN